MKFILEFNENSDFPNYQEDIEYLKDFITEFEDNCSSEICIKSACLVEDCSFITNQLTYGTFYDSQLLKNISTRGLLPGFLIDIFHSSITIQQVYDLSKNVLQFEKRLKSRFSSGSFYNNKNLSKYTYHVHTSSINGSWLYRN